LTTAPWTVSREDAYRIMQERKKKSLLLVKAGRIVGMYVFSDLKRIFQPSGGMHNVDRNGQLVVGAAIGVGDKALRRAELLAKQGCDLFHIDTAHGDSKNDFNTI